MSEIIAEIYADFQLIINLEYATPPKNNSEWASFGDISDIEPDPVKMWQVLRDAYQDLFKAEMTAAYKQLSKSEQQQLTDIIKKANARLESS